MHSNHEQAPWCVLLRAPLYRLPKGTEGAWKESTWTLEDARVLRAVCRGFWKDQTVTDFALARLPLPKRTRELDPTRLDTALVQSVRLANATAALVEHVRGLLVGLTAMLAPVYGPGFVLHCAGSYPVFLQELQRGDWPNWTPGDVDVYLPILDDVALGKVKDLVCEWMTWHQGADSYMHNEIFESQRYGGSSPSTLPEDTVALETPMDWMAPPDVEGHSYTGAKVAEMLEFHADWIDHPEGATAASLVRQLAGVFQAHATRHFGIPKPYKLHRVVKIDPEGHYLCSNTLNAHRIKCIGVNLIMYRSERCLTPAEVTAGFDLAVAQRALTCAAGSEQLTA